LNFQRTGVNSTTWVAAQPCSLILPRNYVDPYSYYRALRATDPVHWHSKLNLWILTRYADIAAALVHPALSSQRPRPRLSEFAEDARRNAGVVYETVATWLLRSDPPAHTRLRRSAAPALRDCVAARVRERIEQTADELLSRVAPSGGMDVITEFAAPLSIHTIATIVGVPAGDHSRFNEWAEAVGAAVEASPDPTRLARARQSLEAANDYLRELMAQRINHPQHDFLSALLRADSKSERLGVDAIIGTSTLLLLAGYETATHLIGNGVLALLHHANQIERLQESPSLWPSAVQELLRYSSPLHGVLRTATRDFDLGGRLIRRGELAAICLAAANRDPARFRDPERLDVGRTPNPHVAFGGGIHHCLGASLGILVCDIAIKGILQRFPRLRLASPRVEWQGNYLFRSQRSLRVLF
jgi:cytochrome P450